MRQRHVHEDIVHVEAMLGQREPHILQKLGTVDDRMHEQVLTRTEMPDIAPAELLAHREDVAIAHGRTLVLKYLFVDVVGDD